MSFSAHAIRTVGVGLILQATPAVASECLKYNEPVKLTGYLGSVVFPGPPNYEDTQKGDTKEAATILFLREPICTDADADHDAVPSIVVLQIVCQKPIAKALGSPVTINGELWAAETAHHHTAVMLECR